MNVGVILLLLNLAAALRVLADSYYNRLVRQLETKERHWLSTVLFVFGLGFSLQLLVSRSPTIGQKLPLHEHSDLCSVT